jgi:hypothetical protein
MAITNARLDPEVRSDLGIMFLPLVTIRNYPSDGGR